MLARIATSLTGLILILYGVIAALSPLPLGVIFIVIGILMIAGANPAARPIIRRARAKWPLFDKAVDMVGARSPDKLKDVIEETDPDAPPPAEDKNPGPP